jgi:hypothetical protein
VLAAERTESFGPLTMLILESGEISKSACFFHTQPAVSIDIAPLKELVDQICPLHGEIKTKTST